MSRGVLLGTLSDFATKQAENSQNEKAKGYLPTSVPPPVVLRELNILRKPRRECEDEHGSVVAGVIVSVVVAIAEDDVVVSAVLSVFDTHGVVALLHSAVPSTSVLPRPRAMMRILIPKGIREESIPQKWKRSTAEKQENFLHNEYIFMANISHYT